MLGVEGRILRNNFEKNCRIFSFERKPFEFWSEYLRQGRLVNCIPRVQKNVFGDNVFQKQLFISEFFRTVIENISDFVQFFSTRVVKTAFYV